MAKPTRQIDVAIELTQQHDYLQALTRFLEIYGTDGAAPVKTGKDAVGLSYFGLCLALVQKKYKEGIDLCKRALDLEFYNGDHYVNLARIYLARGDRKKAVEVADSGLKVAPEHDELLEMRKELGIRARPAVPFLDRANPVNVTLGQARHAAKNNASGEGRRKK
ncbi:MAG TPA: tetratricopeptide repeat protein [Thermoanaerobaculia bacterium]|nr:tetratricopeptide repeat protein [Thermoanaerobaculia bacterium]